MSFEHAAEFPQLTGVSAGAAAGASAEVEEACQAMKLESERPPLARRHRAPHEPTAEEAERHALMHVPHRDWCEVCVCGKARNSPRRRSKHDSTIAQVEMGYFFLTSAAHLTERLTVLVITWAGGGALAATVGVKGVTPYMLRFACGTIETWGLKDIIIRTDQEQAIMALVRSVRDRRKEKTQMANALRHSHASTGDVERVSQTLAPQVRCLRLQPRSTLGAAFRQSIP